MPLPLNKQMAVITGAGSAEGIGFAVARRLRAAGVRVVITSTTDRIHARARELEAGGEGVLSFIADLTVETEVQRLVDSVLSRVGRIDILMQAQSLEMVCQAPLHAAAAAGLAHVDRPSPTAKVERVEARPAGGSRISQWMLRRGPESVDRPPGFSGASQWNVF